MYSRRQFIGCGTAALAAAAWRREYEPGWELLGG